MTSNHLHVCGCDVSVIDVDDTRIALFLWFDDKYYILENQHLRREYNDI